jgi:hypothetical protein
MQSFKHEISGIFLLSLLFACSGGGGGGSSAPGFIDPASCVLPSNVLAITTANAELVTSEVIGTIQSVLVFADAAGTFIDFNGGPVSLTPDVFMCHLVAH